MKEIFLNKSVQIIASDRAGGVSEGRYESLNLGFHVGDDSLKVEKNREVFASYFGASAEELCFMEQRHSSIVKRAKRGETPEADALISADRGLVLCVMVADCVPVILYSAQAVAAVHAGRKGVFSDIIANACEAMRTEFGAKEINAYLGVSIRSCCYEIRGEVLSEAMEKFPYALKSQDGRYFLSLQTILKKQLNENGIMNIIDENVCSCCDKNYFSYRRDGVCGRFALGVRIKG